MSRGKEDRQLRPASTESCSRLLCCAHCHPRSFGPLNEGGTSEHFFQVTPSSRDESAPCSVEDAALAAQVVEERPGQAPAVA
jgi:hypothetical protein